MMMTRKKLARQPSSYNSIRSSSNQISPAQPSREHSRPTRWKVSLSVRSTVANPRSEKRDPASEANEDLEEVCSRSQSDARDSQPQGAGGRRLWKKSIGGIGEENLVLPGLV